MTFAGSLDGCVFVPRMSPVVRIGLSMACLAADVGLTMARSATVIIAKGGVQRCRPDRRGREPPGDDDRVSRDDLVFARGSMHLVSTTLGDPQPSVNPRSCVATITIHQTGEIVGGTRQFTIATGSLSSTVTVRAVLARNPDGSCSFEHEPLHEVDLITATGTLSF